MFSLLLLETVVNPDGCFYNMVLLVFGTDGYELNLLI